MRCATGVCALLLVGPVLPGDDEQGFVHLLSDDQLINWSGDRDSWTLDVEEIRGHSARESKRLVYEGRTFRDYVVRFSAQVRKGSVLVMLRNVPFGWYLVVDTESVYLRDFAVFQNHRGEWADYEVEIRGGCVKLSRNGKPCDLEFAASHAPETGKMSLELPQGKDESEVVLRRIRIRSLP